MLTGSLDLGIATVSLSFIEDMGDDCGRANANKREIKIRKDLEGALLSSTLIHEVLHIYDGLVLGDRLCGGDADHHPTIEALANCLDEFLRRNWQVLEVLYKPQKRAKRKHGR